MLRTYVAAPSCRPETSASIGHARATPKAFTVTTAPVTFTWHFFERAEHCATVLSEEGARCSRIFAQIKAMIGFIFSTPESNREGEGENALHGHAKLIDRMGDCLVTPWWSAVCRVRAQIISLYNDASERAIERARVWILVRGYPEAAPASVTGTRVGTKCTRIDRCRVAVRCYAARCGKDVSVSMGSVK